MTTGAEVLPTGFAALLLCLPVDFRNTIRETLPCRRSAGGARAPLSAVPPHTSHACDALTEEQFAAVLAAVNARTPAGKGNLALLFVVADAGLHVSGATALGTTAPIAEGGQFTHVDIRRGKGGNPGRVALTTRAAASTGAWLEPRAKLGLGHGLLFCTIGSGTAGGHGARTRQTLKPGRPMSPRYVRQLVHRLARRAGIPTRVTPHTLRHTFATPLLRVTRSHRNST